MSEPAREEIVQQAVERAEAAATRRRWVTLAELVGVAGLVIAALGLWVNWSDRQADEQAKQVEKASETKTSARVLLTGSPAQGGERLVVSDARHSVQRIEVRFPKALGAAPRSSEPDPTIEASWVASGLLALTDKGPDDRQGRLPVLITSYWADSGDVDTPRTDSAIYDVVWQTKGGSLPLLGRSLRLKGLMLRERTASPGRLDAIWAREKPVPAR